MNRLNRSVLVGVAVLLTSSVAAAEKNYYPIWDNLYPGSLSDDNVLGTGASCQLCHEKKGGGNNYIGYGWKIREGIKSGGLSVADAIIAAEPFNGDDDPTLSTSLDEIWSDTQPGWTDGPHNTIYFKDGSTSENEMPPSGILGSLDPTVGDVYCTPAIPNSSGEPGRIAAKGSDVALDNDLTLVATDLPADKFGYFLNSQSQGLVMPPGSQGNLCLSGKIGRYAKQIASTGPSGSLVLVLDLTNTPTPGGPVTVMAGETWNFQGWFRDKNPTLTSNFTDGLSVQFQ